MRRPAARRLTRQRTRPSSTAAGARVATATELGKVRIWSMASGERIGPSLSHRLPIYEVDFDPTDPTGRTLATASEDGTVRIWTLPPPVSGREQTALHVETLTRMTMDDYGVLSWLGPADLRERWARLEDAEPGR